MDYKTNLQEIQNVPEQYQEFLQFCENSSRPNAVLLWHFLHNDRSFAKGKCEYCSKDSKFISFKYGYYRFCSKLCSNKFNTPRRIETIQNRYGVRGALQHPDIKQKRTNTNMKKYGVDNFAKSEEFKKVIKENSNKKYGVDHHNQAPINKNKILKTWLINWGKKNPALHPIVQAKIKKTLLERYGVDHPRYTHLNPELLDVIHSKIWWEELFLHDGLTNKEIAKETGLSISYVNQKIREYGLRGKSQSKEYAPNQDDDLFGIF